MSILTKLTENLYDEDDFQITQYKKKHLRPADLNHLKQNTRLENDEFSRLPGCIWGLLNHHAREDHRVSSSDVLPLPKCLFPRFEIRRPSSSGPEHRAYRFEPVWRHFARCQMRPAVAHEPFLHCLLDFSSRRMQLVHTDYAPS